MGQRAEAEPAATMEEGRTVVEMQAAVEPQGQEEKLVGKLRKLGNIHADCVGQELLMKADVQVCELAAIRGVEEEVKARIAMARTNGNGNGN